MSTPHDGNLPIHYACESGCDSQELSSGVLSALLDAFPQGLECKNFKGKKPLILCNTKTRHVLLGVLKTRKQSVAKRNKPEQRCDSSGYSPPEKALYQREYRNPPPLNAHLLPPLMDEDETESYEEEESVDNSEGLDSAWQSDKQASRNQSNRDLSSLHQMGSSKYTENELQQQIEVLISQNRSQQQTISQLNDRLKHITSKDEDNVASDAKLLCQRILSKAEADSVKFRTQIQQLQEEKEQMRQDASRREKMILETLMNVRDLLTEKGEKMKLNLFHQDEDIESAPSQDSTTQYNNLSSQLMEALGTVFSHMETGRDKLQSQVKSLEDTVSNYDVIHKTAQSVNQNLQREKEVLTKRQRDLERKLTELQDEKDSVEQSLADVKEKNSSLVVMNRSLQQQTETNEGVREHFKFNDIDCEGDDVSQSLPVIQQTLEENKTQIATLLKEQEVLKEKNRSLKDTILMNNEKYLNKVHDLGEKYSDLEQVNSDLRKRIREFLKNDKVRSSLKVSLEGEDELLYEV